MHEAIFGYSLVHIFHQFGDALSCWTQVGAWILMIAVNNIAWRPNPDSDSWVECWILVSEQCQNAEHLVEV